ncbi:DUF2945 domain-containing protein [Sphingomonas sp.]|uniref:DUF2945 domain-containing protein n=1 Tax=Sphingomonas sp. TaxID=28214 RepID=UPI002ED7ACB7
MPSQGESVRWRSPDKPPAAGKPGRGAARGQVLHKQTPDMVLKGHQVRASREEPQYIVSSDNGGNAAHKPSALDHI